MFSHRSPASVGVDFFLDAWKLGLQFYGFCKKYVVELNRLNMYVLTSSSAEKCPLRKQILIRSQRKFQIINLNTFVKTIFKILDESQFLFLFDNFHKNILLFNIHHNCGISDPILKLLYFWAILIWQHLIYNQTFWTKMKKINFYFEITSKFCLEFSGSIDFGLLLLLINYNNQL